LQYLRRGRGLLVHAGTRAAFEHLLQRLLLVIPTDRERKKKEVRMRGERERNESEKQRNRGER
jgi:hypothetical protein